MLFISHDYRWPISENWAKENLLKMMNEVKAFMNPSKELLMANYVIKYLGEEKIDNGIVTWHLEFTPKIEKNYYKTGELWVDSNGMAIQMKAIKNNNDSITVLFTNLEKNIALKGGDFQVNPPKGTKLIKD